jgi:formylmethanofuran dehydrogenase subunit E
MKIDMEALNKMFEFHGHKCWASTLGFRAGLIALEKLGAERIKSRGLYAIIETGYSHGAVCFLDGLQYATGCTVGKAALIWKPRGKLAFTLIDAKKGKQIRIAYKFNPEIREKIAQTSFMKKRAQGIPPHEIPEEEAWEAVKIVLEAPEEEIFVIGEVEDSDFEPPEEILGAQPCEICGEWVSPPYLRILGNKKVCIDCAGYEEGFEK